MNVLGLSCYYHDAAACLIKDGRIIAAAQEERFNRDKYSPDFPIQAVNYCLQEANLTAYDIDYIGFYEKPYLKFERIIINYLKTYPFSLSNFLDSMPNWLKDRLTLPLVIKNELGFKGKTFFIKHHLAHAASSFFSSGFDEAAILTVDGVGEWATATYGKGTGKDIRIYKEMRYPDSLGLLYSIITTYLGFRVFSGEGKVMALAECGEPAYLDAFRKFILIRPDGSFRLDPKYFLFNKGNRMYSGELVKILGQPRKEGAPIAKRYCDIAASLQKITEEVLLKMALHLYKEVKIDKLCLAGGVFLNVTSNSRILKEAPFKEVFIQPAAGDSGAALGAALYVYNSLFDRPRIDRMRTAFLGPEFSSQKIRRVLQNRGADFKEFDDADLVKYAAARIAENKIVGWFQGRMEWGPRALGNRSILANPCNPEMKDILNEKVKHRESFRPYAVSILKEECNDYFDLNAESPFMLLVGNIRESKRGLVPSAYHVNGAARIQTVTESDNGLLYSLIKEFRGITGIPMVINTSFNDNNEPIVCTPEDAYLCFMRTKMDYLVMGNYVVSKH